MATQTSSRRQARNAVPPEGAQRRRGLALIADALLWVAALGGLACIVLVILAKTMSITLIMFSTGSMSPTIPAGSVAVVQAVPASELQVGDVVTVDRENLLPVTHRITTIEPGESSQERIITMRGDANEHDDPHPYQVTEVRKVLWSVPGLAKVIIWFGNPYVLGGITLAAAFIVGWAFWPKAEPQSAESRHRNEYEESLENCRLCSSSYGYGSCPCPGAAATGSYPG